MFPGDMSISYQHTMKESSGLILQKNLEKQQLPLSSNFKHLLDETSSIQFGVAAK